MKPITRFVISALAATTLIPAAVMAQDRDTVNQGYLVDSRGVSVMSGTGLCWRHRDPDQPAVQQTCDPIGVAADVTAPRPVAAVPPAVPPARAAAPVVIAAAPVAPPAAKPRSEPAKPAPQRITFSGDALFAFNKSVLKPEGKAMLDGLVQQLQGASYDSILATGHTDRFGSNAYNQKLSERRAHAVKDYLVSRNVPANRIAAEGKGEANPMTKAGECPGAKSAKVVACLQPDRRVDVEMRGSRTVTGSL